MKKTVNKFTKILLLIAVIFSDLMTPISVLADVINKANPNKGDVGINNQVSNDGGNSTSVSATSTDGNITVDKTVRKTKTNGRYEVEFNIKGKDIVDTVTKPAYVVVVFDRSGSMGEKYGKDKFDNAKNGAKTFAKTLLKNVKGSQIALVTFATEAKIAREFSSNNLDYAIFGKPDGGTNLHHGLIKANELLSNSSIPSNANKYIVVIGDGTPTYYMNSKNKVKGEGNETNKETFEATTKKANEIKDGGIEIFSIGYDLPSDKVYGDYTAKDILTMVSTTDSEEDKKNGVTHYMDADPTAVAETFIKIAESISRTKPGTNGTLIDNIGSNFKITTDGGKTYTSEIIPEINDKGANFKFYVDIDKDSPTGWYDVNNGFTLKYTDASGKEASIVYKDADPQVYWVQNEYKYIVNYYKDSITKGNLIASDERFAANGTVINIGNVQKDKYLNKENTIGYEFNSLTPDSIVITNDGSVKQINVLYTKKLFNYKVEYYYDGVIDNSLTINKNNIPYGTKVDSTSHYLKDKDIREGYILDSELSDKNIYTIIDNNVVIKVFYKKKNFNYNIKYHFNGVNDPLFNRFENASFGTIVNANNNYLEDVNKDGLINKENTDNKDYFVDPNNALNNETIIIDGDNKELNIHYISTKEKDDGIKDITKTANLEKIVNSKTPITYTIDYKNVLVNVNKDSTVKFVITDTLPYAIDTNNSKTNLNGGQISDDNKTITWTFETTYNEYMKEVDISRKFDYTVVYDDIANISSSKNNTLVNKAVVDTYVNDRLIDTDNDDATVIVEVKGNLTVEYIAREVNNGVVTETLLDSTKDSKLVGTDYVTTSKPIHGYTLDESNLPLNATGKYIDGDIVVKYYYTKNAGVIDNPIVDKNGPESINSVNDKFNYTINASAIIKDYSGKATITVTDTLPYEIDSLNSDLNGGKLGKDNKTITWTKEYNVTDNNFKINETFNISVKFKNLNSGSVINNVNSKITIGSVTDSKDDNFETIVNSGDVVATYKTKDGKVLHDNVTTTGLGGTKYDTTKKEFIGYHLEATPKNKSGLYEANKTIYVNYVYIKDEGLIEVPTTVKEGPKYVNGVNSVFNYKINSKATIKDYVGEATLTVVDTLPFEINSNLSKLDNRCVITDSTTITCTKVFDIKESDYVTLSDGTKVYNIDETFNLDIVYKNINSNNVTNVAKSTIKLDKNNVDSIDDVMTEVKKGTVIATYNTNDGVVLHNNVETTGLGDTSYTTETKEFTGYTLVSVPSNKSGTYKADSTIQVDYIYTKNDGKIEEPSVIKTGDTVSTSIDNVFKYTINAKGTIKEYVGKATITVTDTLPYEIDTNYKNSLAGGKLSDDHKTITWVKEYDVIEDNFVINEIFNIEVKFVGITTDTITNKVDSVIDLGKTKDEKHDEIITKIKKGNVIATYETTDGVELHKPISSTGIGGSSYTTDEKTFTGYTLTEIPKEKDGKYVADNTITVKYIYTKNAGIIDNPIVKKQGSETTDNINNVFKYTINASTVIKEYDGKAYLTVTDTLPYAIDKNSKLDGGILSEDGKTITWKKEYDVNKDNFEINETFNIEVKFTNIDLNNEDVTNKVESFIKLDKNEDTKNDEVITKVLKGTVIATYKTNNGEELHSNVETTGLGGSKYDTEAKTFTGYTLVSVPSDKSGIYAANKEIYVDYVYEKNDGIIDKPVINKTGDTSAPSIDSVFNYNVNASAVIKDYVGKATVTITDTLPYEIDTNSEYNLAGGKLGKDNKTITWIKEYDVNTNDFVINETFNISVKYKNITDEKVVNKADLLIDLGKTKGGDHTEIITNVIKSTVKAIYVEEGNEDNILSPEVNINGLVGSNYTTDSKDVLGYTLVGIPENKAGLYTKEDILVKYLYKKNDGIIDNPKVEKIGDETTNSIDNVFKYTINANATIKDYKGKATITVTDTLPYAIDKNSKLDGGILSQDGKTITWTKEYDVKENNFVIDETFNIEVKFIDIVTEEVTNKVNSLIKLDNNEDTKTDEVITKVMKGEVIAIYKTNDGTKLHNDVTTNGLAGSKYDTENKSFLGYTLVNVPANKEGKYRANETITVEYVYIKNDGVIEVPTTVKNGDKFVNGVNSVFNYTINSKATIKDYSGTATLKVVDTLPYEIDLSKSQLDNRCALSDDLKTITCTKGYEIEENNFEINETFNLKLAYKNITSNEVVNKAKSYIILDSNKIETEDDAKTEVKKGTVVAIYKTNDGVVLHDNVETTGLGDTLYSTEEKVFHGYTLKEVPANKTGNYKAGTTIYVDYIYTKNDGTIDKPFVDKIGSETTSSIDDVFKYTIKANATIKDYKGIATITITDTLPYAIDKNSKLDGGILSEDLKTITWTKEYDVKENNFVIDETFNIEVKFIDIVTEEVTNKVNSLIKLDKIKDEKEDEVITKVEKGNVIAKYETTDGIKLHDDITTTGLVGSKYTTDSKEVFGYTLVDLPENKDGIYTKEDTIVKYLYKKNDGTIDKPVVEKQGSETNDSIDNLFKYTINAKGTIKDYVGRATITITDILPYAIDKNSKLDGGILSQDGKTITWTKEYDVKENNFVIDETFNIEVKFIDIVTEEVTNKVESLIKLDKIEDKKEDEVITKVEKGNVIAKYETTDGIKLHDDVTTSGIGGSKYDTEKKEFNGYTLEKVPANKEGTYKANSTIEVKYIYTKNNGVIEVPTTIKNGNKYVNNINSVFNYDITSKATIKDYTGKATLKVVDTLPYELDLTKSELDDRCVLSEDGKTIICTKEYEIKEENYEINETFNLKLAYKNITSSEVINKATSYITLDGNKAESEDDAKTEVETGKVTVQYVGFINGKFEKLTEDVTLVGPIGSKYETTKEVFDDFTFAYVDGQANGEYSEDDKLVIYVYTTIPMPPQTGFEGMFGIEYLLGALILFIIRKMYKTLKA